ncbi:molybdenum cofactor guanylyltransferase [Desulfuromonas acetexigens]|nr:molybdenum cofactor guanylyltransferase [Desulfuromonas acetexigens]
MTTAGLQQSMKTVPFPDVTGVILAGGRSRRMGRDKATLEIGGKALIAGISELFGRLFPQTLIAGDRPDLARPNLPAYADAYPGSALGGLHTGLRHAETPYIFVAACDMPFVDEELIRALLEHRFGYDVILPGTPEGLEPLIACYGQNCLPVIRRQLQAGNFRILDIYPELRMRIVGPEELPDNWRTALTNINTPADLANAVRDN